MISVGSPFAKRRLEPYFNETQAVTPSLLPCPEPPGAGGLKRFPFKKVLSDVFKDGLLESPRHIFYACKSYAYMHVNKQTHKHEQRRTHTLIHKQIHVNTSYDKCVYLHTQGI